jgi:hypothetical protein
VLKQSKITNLPNTGLFTQEYATQITLKNMVPVKCNLGCLLGLYSCVNIVNNPVQMCWFTRESKESVENFQIWWAVLT